MPQTLYYFAWVAELVGKESEQHDFAPDCTVEDVLNSLSAQGGGYSAAFSDRSRLRFALDGQMTTSDTPIGDACELAVFPPVTGGMVMRHIVVSHDPFDANALLSELGRIGAGAIASFIGHVRSGGENGHELSALELTHYPGQTEAAIARFADEMSERWALDGVAIHHRIGRLAVGEPIIFVATAARHRGAALESVDFAMDRLKQDVFLWKKEHRNDGSAAWIESRPSDSERAERWQA